MARGLTHPTAHVGSLMKHGPTGKEYVYEGFEFHRDITASMKNIDGIIDEIGAKKKTGAIFYFKKSNKRYGVVYYATSVTASSSINAGKLNMQYSNAKGATENLRIQATNMIGGGKSERLTINGQDNVSCKTFTSADTLKKSIIAHLKSNKNVGNHIVDVVEDYLSSANLSTIKWNNEFQDSEKNELGKYLGELIIGAVALKKQSSRLSMDPFGGNASKFIVPDDPAFSGVDSAVLLKDGTMVPISSKLGAGAKASVYTNLLPKAMDKKTLPNSVIKDLVDTAKSLGITKQKLDAKQGAKEIAYEYGIRNILKLKNRDVPDTYAVYLEIKSAALTGKLNTLSAPTLKVISAISAHRDIPSNVKDALPLSVTSAFNREIARRLNNDDKSKDLVADILAGKNFYQANLDVNKWKNGTVYFRMLHSSKAETSFIGSKAAINDIDAKQGLVNYELKYK